MANLAEMMDQEATKIVTYKGKQVRVMDAYGKLKEAFARPEMVGLLNPTGERKSHHRSLVKRAVADFEAMTTYEYRVQLEDGKTRRAFTEELANPNEFLFARPKLHAAKTLYKRYALVLWIATGYSGYASEAGITIKFTRLGRKLESNAIEQALSNEKVLLDAMDWWESVGRRKDVHEVLRAAKAYANGITYKSSPTKAIEPYIDWETAANAVMGMQMASGESNKSARKYKYQKTIRPDEKAQFIKDYIEAEKRMQGVLDSQSVREMEEVCLKIEKMMKKYDLFNTEKTRDIIASIRRSQFTRVTIRQREYLMRILDDIKNYEEVKEKRKVGEDLFDVDKFFDEITGGV